ncbi:transcriptional regulator, AsnC family [Emticicia oligotrophica DSM 17448]|uniref:Transcriptional regulator, AsnC family n=1 Tax=Emticicia oligotrophica (strain DSM 17448 / CIP 109782 / MTCC 6937 / GPTSA100-15) TaxID=929562 RepID=A0ABM5MYS5_EMTOG|nr:Lrp/AsnC ligand binding domain-containing protein [Emticicia oligotrophica]AFK02308.1 transcriptional regulator, AsnC family [Emticicia oligotrophica DSM 17448]
MTTESLLDEFDKKILIQLEKDGRKPYSEIAKNLGISNTMVHQRVTRMKKIGILKGAGIILDERKLGYEWSAFTGLVLKEDSDSKAIIEELKKIPEVTECYYITGQYTLYIRIVAKSNEHMRSVLYDKIDHITGILKTESMIDFGAAFKRNVSVEL